MLALERRLGQELFERLPRGYVLTDQGRELLVRAADLADQIAPIESELRMAVSRLSSRFLPAPGALNTCALTSRKLLQTTTLPCALLLRSTCSILRDEKR